MHIGFRELLAKLECGTQFVGADKFRFIALLRKADKHII